MLLLCSHKCYPKQRSVFSKLRHKHTRNETYEQAVGETEWYSENEQNNKHTQSEGAVNGCFRTAYSQQSTFFLYPVLLNDCDDNNNNVNRSYDYICIYRVDDSEIIWFWCTIFIHLTLAFNARVVLCDNNSQLTGTSETNALCFSIEMSHQMLFPSAFRSIASDIYAWVLERKWILFWMKTNVK